MSQSPFPQDAYAVARMDWCRPSNSSEGGQVAQLLCHNLARQCGSFTNATKDPDRISHTAPLLQELLKAPEIEAWSGPPVHAQIQGICGLGGALTFEKELWDRLGQSREQAIYERIQKGAPPKPRQAQDERGAGGGYNFCASPNVEAGNGLDPSLFELSQSGDPQSHASLGLPFL